MPQQSRAITTFQKPIRAVKAVYIHCSASDRPEDDNVATIRAWHLARGWSDIGYHFFIDKAGIIWTGRPLELIPAAQKNFNTGSIAICLSGLTEFKTKQFAALIDFCEQIDKAYNHGVVTFHGHCEVSTEGKTCPNFDYKTILGLDPQGVLAS